MNRRQWASLMFVVVAAALAGIIYLVLFTPISWDFEGFGPNGETVSVTAEIRDAMVHLQEADLWVPIGTVARVMGLQWEDLAGNTIDQYTIGNIYYDVSWSGWNVKEIKYVAVEFAAWGKMYEGIYAWRIPWWPADQDASWSTVYGDQWYDIDLDTEMTSGDFSAGRIDDEVVSVPATNIHTQAMKGVAPIPVDGGEGIWLAIAGRAIGADEYPATATIIAESHDGGEICTPDGQRNPANYDYKPAEWPPNGEPLGAFRSIYLPEQISFQWVQNLFRARLADLFGIEENKAVIQFWMIIAGLVAALVVLAYLAAKNPKRKTILRV